MSLRIKTLLAVVLIEAALLSIVVWNGLALLQQFSHRELLTRATTAASLVATAARNAVATKNLSALESLIAESLKNPGIVYIRVLDENNNALAIGGAAHALQRPFRADRRPRAVDDGSIDTAAEISANGNRLGQVQLGLSTSASQQFLTSAYYKTLGVIALIILLTALLFWFLSSYISRRFADFSAALQRLAEGEFGYQLHWRGHTEVANTAAAFNHMSGRIKQFFAELREQELRKSAILDSIPDCIIATDQHGLINDFNVAAEATFGYPRRQLLGKPAKYLLAPQFHTAFTQSIANYLSAGNNPLLGQRTEISAVRADNSEFPAELTISAVRLSEQLLFTVYLRDISARKQAESERQRLMLAVEASPDSIFITDTQGLIRYVNPAFTTITGWTAAEIIGQPPGALKSEQMATGFYADMWASLQQGKIWTGRILKRRKRSSQATGQELFWAQSTIAPIQGPNGQLQGYVAVERDITEAVQREERELYEKESAETRARVSQILQSQKPLQERFQDVLKRVAQISGLAHKRGCVLLRKQDSDALEVFITHDDSKLEAISQEHYLAFQARLHAKLLAADEIIVSDECPFSSSTGYYAVPLRHADKILGFLLLLTEAFPSRDSTRLAMLRLIGEMMGLAIANHRVQQEMEKARQAAEDAARTKSQFFANMSHEIRTPMYGVMGMLDLLRHNDLTAAQREYVDTAQSSARLLLSIIDDILDFSKIEAGELQLEHIDFNVGQTLEEVTALLAERAHRKQIELTCFVAAQVPHTVRGDPTRLQQVLTNLIGNAIKFTEQGEVAVSVTAQEEQAEQICLLFEVRDTGIGIAPDAQQRLFRPFSQADGSTNRRYGGTGLGLVISKQLVELMGGAIEFASVPQQGSTFRFTARFDNPTLSLPARPNLKGIRVLVADDNATSRAILENYLQRWGIIHDSAANGLKALNKLRRMAERGCPYQVAILDGQLPALDGIELARLIQADSTLHDLRLILLSCLTQPHSALTASGYRFYVNKPVRRLHLYEALVSVMNNEFIKTTPLDIHAPAPLPQLQGRVLLVEDNEVNQLVGLQLLKQLGLETELAIDGHEAIEAVKRRHYDAILMDCQMPQLDGFEATRAIRALEQSRGKARTPIIALTASAMTSDREACLAAGMDDYLAKPFEAQMLSKLLCAWLPRKSADTDSSNNALHREQTAAAQPSTAALTAVIDQQKLKEIRDLLDTNFSKLVQTFATMGNALIEEMRKAAAAGDITTLSSKTHHLKGSSSNIGAMELFELCRGLEQAARQGKTQDLLPQVDKIASAYLRVCTQLRTSN